MIFTATNNTYHPPKLINFESGPRPTHIKHNEITFFSWIGTNKIEMELTWLLHSCTYTFLLYICILSNKILIKWKTTKLALGCYTAHSVSLWFNVQDLIYCVSAIQSLCLYLSHSHGNHSFIHLFKRFHCTTMERFMVFFSTIQIFPKQRQI